MACVGCRKKADGTVVVQNRRVAIPVGPDRVFEYIGTRGGQFNVNSVVQPGKKYRVRRGEPFTVPAGDAEYRFAKMKDFREIVPDPQAQGALIPEQPISPPQIVVPEAQPEPVVAGSESKLPERVDDLDRLGLHFLITDALRAGDFHTVDQIVFDIRAGDGAALKKVKGIAQKRYEKIVKAVEALEAA